MTQFRAALRWRSLIRALAVASVLLVAPGWGTRTHAVTSTTGKEFLYWIGDLTFAQNNDHISVTQLVSSDPASVAIRLQALPPDMKAAVPAGLLAAGGCSLRADWSQHWAAMAAAVGPYLNKVAVFLLDDEPDNRAVGDCFQSDPSLLNRQLQMKQLMETTSAIVKSPAGWSTVKTWVNYGQWWFVVPGIQLAQNVDWNGFDCYGPFDNCFGSGYTIPQLVDLMAVLLPNASTQSIFPITDASCFRYHNLELPTHESELFIRALQYWQLASTHPRVKGMVGFLWDWGGDPHPWLVPANSIHDINDSPGLTTLYRHIGLNLLTGFIPSTSTLAAPPECVIPVGQSACTANLGWSTISGPYVGAFARLAGQYQTVSGALCPGATSCAVPAAVGDYIVELREYWWDANSKLIDAKAVEVRHGSGAPTGQIAFTPSSCYLLGRGTCDMVLKANVQNAAAAGFFVVGLPTQICGNGAVNHCSVGLASWQFPPGPYSFTVQLRANRADPNSQLLDQRTFSFTVYA